MSAVPAAAHTLAVLRHLAAQPRPVPAASIARVLGLPRSTTYHLLRVMTEAGFVVHLPEERRYGLGISAFELGTAYTRQAPLARLARPVLARLVDQVGHNAHLAVLHGREVVCTKTAVQSVSHRKSHASSCTSPCPGCQRPRYGAGAGTGSDRPSGSQLRITTSG